MTSTITVNPVWQQGNHLRIFRKWPQGMRKTSTCLMAIACLSVAGIARGDAFYVATNGTGAGTSWSAAFTNLQDALDVVDMDDTIHVAGQTFTLTATLAWSGCTNVTIRGGYAATNDAALPGANDPATWPTVFHGNNSVQVMTVSGVTSGRLELVTITRGRTGSFRGGGLAINSCQAMTISGCTISDNFADDYGGGFYTANSDVLMTNCVVKNNLVDDGGGYGSAFGGGISAFSGTLTVRDSVISGNSVTADSAGRGGGVHVNTANVTLMNVLLTGNAPKTSGYAIYTAGGSLAMTACTVAWHGIDGLHRQSGTVSITNCIFRGNGDELVGTIANLYYSNIHDGTGEGVNGCISADPKFEYGHYLGGGSPCIDAGTNSASDYGLDAYTTQADGTPDTGRMDMGYHYKQGAALAYTDIYVSGGGSDLGEGTNWPTAFRSLTKAISHAIDGSRIHVASGQYTNGVETFPLTVSDAAGIHFLGTNRSDTVVDAGGAGRVLTLDNVSGVSTLSGLTLRGGISALPGGGLYVRNCGSVTVTNCAIRDNRKQVSAQSAYGGGVYAEGSGLTFINSLVGYNSSQYGRRLL